VNRGQILILYWQNCIAWYYYTGAWNFTNEWNNFIPLVPLSAILPNVCHLQTRFSDSCRKGSAAGASTNTIAICDFCISLYTVVQVNEMMLSLIFSTYHLSWNPSLTGNIPAFSEWQGYLYPCGYGPRVWVGMGMGMASVTLQIPIPMRWVLRVWLYVGPVPHHDESN
jgi:hypothetical protein